MKRFGFVGVIMAGIVALAGQAAAEGDAANGEKHFNAGFLRCSSCHSLEAGETKVGPSLAGLFGREAGTVEEFERYSEAMVNSTVIWDEETLSEFLKDPRKFIPGSRMGNGAGIFARRVSSESTRADLIAYLRQATAQ